MVKLNIVFPERIAVDEERARELRKADERQRRRKRNRFKATDGQAAKDVEDEVYEDDDEEEEEEEEGDVGKARTQVGALSSSRSVRETLVPEGAVLQRLHFIPNKSTLRGCD